VWLAEAELEGREQRSPGARPLAGGCGKFSSSLDTPSNARGASCYGIHEQPLGT